MGSASGQDSQGSHCRQSSPPLRSANRQTSFQSSSYLFTASALQF